MALRRKVLIVEDEILIGMDLAISVEEAGFEVSGPYKSPEGALAALETETPDIGLLDLNLGRDQTSEKVAERLQAMGRPFIFLTGYSASSHPVVQRFAQAPCLSKPVNMAEIADLIEANV